MKGTFMYYDQAYRLVEVYDTDDIPASARELVRWELPEAPLPPHTDEDHKAIAARTEEFEKVYLRVYGRPTPKPQDMH